MKKLNKVCKMIVKLSAEEFLEAEEMVDQQLNYFHPFKNATANRLHRMGKFNKEVIKRIKELHEFLKEEGENQGATNVN